jgi:hypothetical protein
VIASSAGYPDDVRRKTLPFPLFATAGSEDFNHLEMRRLDRELTSPHRLVIFDGGHVWLSSALALEAVEWMELQAIRTSLKPKEPAEIDRLLAVRKAAVFGGPPDHHTFLALQAIVTDFDGLADVSDLARRVAELGRDEGIRAALRNALDDDRREESIMREMTSLADRLSSGDRQRALAELRQRWTALSAEAKQPTDTTGRQLTRRVLAALSADGTTDAEYAQIIAEYRMPRAGTPR